MEFLVQQPVWAWSALAIAAAGIAAAILTRRQSRAWRTTAIFLPLAAACCAALALAGLAITMPDSRHVVILLDGSPSARRQPWQAPASVRKFAQLRLGDAVDVTVVGYGPGGTRLLLDRTPAGDLTAWPETWPAHEWAALESSTTASHRAADSGLTAAFAWRSRQEQQGGALRPRWVITDGLDPPSAQTPPMPTAWAIFPPAQIDLALRDLRLETLDAAGPDSPAQVEIHALLRAVAGSPVSPSDASRPDLTAQLEVFRGDQRVARQIVNFPLPNAAVARGLDVGRWVTLRDQPPPDSSPVLYTLTLTLLPEVGTDAWPENNHATVYWSKPESLRMLLVGHMRPAALADAPLIPADRFTADARQLAAEGWQLVVLCDVPAETLPHAPEAVPLSSHAAVSLDRFVRDAGGGLLILADGHALGPGHYGEGTLAGDLLERLSPLSSRRLHGPGHRLVLLLDASASMNQPARGSTVAGAPAATGATRFQVLARAVRDALAMLADDDPVTAITFNDRAQVIADGALRATAATLAENLAGVSPQGPTAPDCALDILDRTLVDSAMPTTVILVTDGEIPAMEVSRWSALLARSYAQLLVVAPPAPDSVTPPPALHRLMQAVPAIIWMPAADPSAWADLLRRALAQRVRGAVERADLPWVTLAGEPPVTGIAAAWTRAWARPEALIVARSTSPGEAIPLAAIAQRGLGRVGTLAIAPDESPACQSIVSRLVRRLAAAPADRRFHIDTQRLPDGAWRITAQGIDANRFLNSQDLALRLLAPGSAPQSDQSLIPMRQCAPGLYEATVPAPGPLAAVVIRRDADRPEDEQLVARVYTADVPTHEWPASSQPVNRWPGQLLPASLADETLWRPVILRPIDLARGLWLSAAALALAALWLRRHGLAR